jgi:hypothetical protein
MKRSPLKRSTKPLKRTPLKRISDKKWKEVRETKASRHANIELGVTCEFCGREPAIERHEIAGGMSRHIAVYEPHQQVDVCRACHDKWQGLPYAQQLAMKIKASVRAVNRCRGCRAVSVEKVVMYLMQNS